MAWDYVSNVMRNPVYAIYIINAERLIYFQFRTWHVTELVHINFIQLNAIYEKL